MLTIIEGVFSPDEAHELRVRLEAATWQDGRSTAGSRSASVKDNRQIDEHDPLAIEIGNEIVRRIGGNPLFLSSALPERIYPPRFNRYSGGGHYGVHVDAALMQVPGASMTLRSDISATLFLSEPEEYDGGELVIEDRYGAQTVKLPAGDMVLYPSSSLHQVTAVTRGARLASFFWVQSAIADASARELLFDLDQSIQALSVERGQDDPDIDRLTHVYHNLVRRWANV
jgi:PKHD-type hydroxylase